MELLTPKIGLVFWTIVIFVSLLLILKKFAWKPILKAVKDREETIENALKAAEKAKQEVQALQNKNEELLAQAKLERDEILKAAREAKDKIIAEAKEKATAEGERLLAIAHENIHNEKLAAITELKNEVANLSIEIAEKVLRNKLTDDKAQVEYINKLVSEINLN